MDSLEQVLPNIDTITFDCYGTLIDWRAGIGRSLAELFEPAADEQTDDIFEAYVRTEAEVEAGVYQSYRRTMMTAIKRAAGQFGHEFPADRAERMAEMLPNWPPFEDTREALQRLKRRYRLGVLSNIDRDLFAGTARRIGVAFDFVVTAEDVQSYKPAPAHFERLLAQHAKRGRVLHVAQSLFHDGVPATRLGIAYVWINRYKGVNDTTVRPLAAYPDLKLLADVAWAGG